jgi:ubiquinone/menaquinone biosynthesis C-methylase UbiE
MTTALDRAAYLARQRLRQSWYLGQKWLSARLAEPVSLPDEVRARMPGAAALRADLAALLERDWANIEAGFYLSPEPAVDSPLDALRAAGRYFADLPKVEARRRQAANDEIFRATEPGQYPRYYLQNFHYQTDGYLSRESAKLYDHQVEVLFGGAAAAMRRQALVPLRALLAERGIRGSSLLDVACGTGRFLREVKSNYPRLAVTGVDFSPYYLDEARQALAPWSGVTLIEASATAVPAVDESFDAVTSCFLFHELPAKERRNVAREMARLVKQGGLVILVDSIQRGDAPDFDALLEYFPTAFHEPYYADYARCDLAALFAEAGLTLEASERAYLSKVMSFRKAA